MTVLPSPTEMIASLNRVIQGQTRAKRTLARAFYSHFMTLASQDAGIAATTEHQRHHILLAGPTGSGKTFLVRSLANLLGVPLITANAASLSATGYVGESVSDLLARLSRAIDESPRSNGHGIIFIDELDKIARHASPNTPDVRGEMVQQELLSLFDGTRIGRIKDGDVPVFEIDGSRILVVCAGAFVGIDRIQRRRITGNQLGFAGNGEMSAKRNTTSQAPPLDSEDFIEFGFIPELVGRFGHFATLDTLTVPDLSQILTTLENSPLAYQQHLFSLHGLTLEFTEDAVLAIAEEAFSRGAGARGLAQLVNRCVASVDWRLDVLWQQGITRITVEGSTIREGSEPRLHADGPRIEHPPAIALRQVALSHPPALALSRDPNRTAIERAISALEEVNNGREQSCPYTLTVYPAEPINRRVSR